MSPITVSVYENARKQSDIYFFFYFRVRWKRESEVDQNDVFLTVYIFFSRRKVLVPRSFSTPLVHHNSFPSAEYVNEIRAFRVLSRKLTAYKQKREEEEKERAGVAILNFNVRTKM